MDAGFVMDAPQTVKTKREVCRSQIQKGEVETRPGANADFNTLHHSWMPTAGYVFIGYLVQRASLSSILLADFGQATPSGRQDPQGVLTPQIVAACSPSRAAPRHIFYWFSSQHLATSPTWRKAGIHVATAWLLLHRLNDLRGSAAVSSDETEATTSVAP
eukprot:TRINITY_DN23262_c0_g2_i1.p2 TRINITY_DN23262_c0_g2~~TRINITY_DN23262_c0_g2_i1.p2  ORF type:complete len:160 (+),score=15.22 TRINITY_DN23262_c0_g2_i1:1125-1604(+)